jgi:hypothetical protein
MASSEIRVALDNDPWVDWGAPLMEFRLTYAGALYSTGNDVNLAKDKRAEHKHAIRRAFHPQLKRLWDITPYLKTGERSGPSALILSGDASNGDAPQYKASYLAKKHARYGWRFVPLVTADLDLICGIEVLFLRPTIPGGIIKSGDIDGRLKTLLDALSIPDANQGYENRTASADENPLYVLLEDDKLITKVSVETDQLLEFSTAASDINDARLVITIRLRPYEMHLGNMQFG